MTAVYTLESEKSVAKLVAVVAMVITVALAAIHGFINYCWATQACGSFTVTANNYGYLFNLNTENNIPTWFSVALLILVAVVALPIALHQRQMGERTLAWWGLCAIFAYLSLDEGSDLHGLWAAGIDHPEVFGFSQQFFAWVVPGSIVVMVIASLYVRWLNSLPVHTRNLIVAAGIAYVGGGLVLELIGGRLADATYLNASYLVVSTFEELFEMIGAVIMLFALLDHAHTNRVTFHF